MIKDLARAGAPASHLAATRFETTCQPPFDVEISCDPAELSPRSRYVLRATLRQGDWLVAITDTAHTVLTGEAADPAQMVMRLVDTGGEQAAHGDAVNAAKSARLLVNVEGRITQLPAGPQLPGLTVLRFNAADPGSPCPDPSQQPV